MEGGTLLRASRDRLEVNARGLRAAWSEVPGARSGSGLRPQLTRTSTSKKGAIPAQGIMSVIAANSLSAEIIRVYSIQAIIDISVLSALVLGILRTGMALSC